MKKIHLAFCQNIGYSTTCFPNIFGDTEEYLISERLENTRYLWKCSPFMKEYLCSLLLPKCQPSGKPHWPCQSFTKYIQSNCVDFDFSFNKELLLAQMKLPINDSYCYAPQIDGEL